MRSGRRCQTPLIESFPEPERAFHRRRRENHQMGDREDDVAALRCQLEEIRLAAEASATRERAQAERERTQAALNAERDTTYEAL